MPDIEGLWDDPLDNWFELSYAQYLTVPRSVLQSMPGEWKVRFAQCLEELDATIDWRPKGFTYWVTAKADSGKFTSIATADPFMDYERGRRQVEHRDDAEERLREAQGVKAQMGRTKIDYTNYKGERRVREIYAMSIRYGSNEWHREPQFLLSAIDYEKKAVREFAMKDIHQWGVQ